MHKASCTTVTRLHYPKDDPKFISRLKTFRDRTLPSLLLQTDPEFSIYVWCEVWHSDIVKALHPRVNVFHANWVERSANGYFIDYTHWKDIKGLPKYEIQVGLDSDDRLAPEAIAKIRDVCKGGKRLCVSLQPLKEDLNNGMFYHMRDYKTHRCSPVFALYQPRNLEDDFMFAYQVSHMKLAAYCDKKIQIPEGYAFMGIGSHNESTRLDPTNDRLWT